MTRHIPTYALDNLHGKDSDIPDVLFLSQPLNQTKEPLIIPHRTNYYGIGICLAGEARLTANLETYEIIPDCLIAMSPHVIKQWHFKSDDFRSFAILFSKNFLNSSGETLTDRFPFFESVARHIFLLSSTNAENLKRFVQFIKEKSDRDNKFSDEVTRSLINGLLYEVASLYEEFSLNMEAVQTRSQLLAADFKKLVNQNFNKERSVSFYAEQLFITPNHLTETVSAVTGRTPGAWIAEAVVLEASVLLHNPALTVAQIAEYLHFSDQSAFGKYFKNLKGLSPVAYRKG
jgi:AraC family transcriptional activator of pobA